MVDELIEQKVVESISTSEISRILRENDLQPHRNRYWLHVKPDEFRDERITTICSVYANAATTSDELIISYDEMTGGAGTSKDCRRFTDVSRKAAGY